MYKFGMLQVKCNGFHRRSVLFTTIVIAVAFFLAANIYAQGVNGSIIGTVSDASHAVVVGTQVTATNLDTNANRNATSDSAGQYRILVLPPGRYKITANAPGFRQFTANDIDLKVDDQLRINVTLTVGDVEQAISVEANPVQVNTESTQLGNTIESKEMLSMPLNGRSYLDLLSLTAGVVPITANTLNNDRPVSGTFGRPGNQSVNGQSEVANNFMVNGGDVNEAKNMGAGLLPNLESVAEFHLITNSFDAEHGKHSGAVMNTITKSGTNRLHGTVFEFLRNDLMDSRSFFDPYKAELRRNQFGYAVGGPFWKNKLFWFTDYQATRQVQGASTGLLQLPNVAQRQGIFNPGSLSGSVNGVYWAQQLSQKLGYQITNGEPYSFAGCSNTTACVFPGGVIPQIAFDKVSVNYMKYFPQPNLNPATGLYADASGKGTARDDKAAQRVDFINQKTGTWSFYYHFDDSLVFSPLSTQGNSSAVSLPGTPISTPERAQMFVMSNTKSIGPSMVNEWRASFFRTSLQTAVPDKAGYADTAGLGFTTGIGTLGINPTGPAGYPDVLTPLYFNNYTLGPNWLNLYSAQNTYMMTEGFSKIVGQHSLKFGGEIRYYQLNVRNICGPEGYFTFNGIETGNDFADFLIGAPSNYVQCSMQFLNNRANYGGAYIQDSWKVKPNLTLNLGLRWEVSEPWTDTQGMLETTVPGKQSTLFPTAPLGLLVPGDPGVPSSISPTQWNTFAPRIGLAYSPNYSDGLLGRLFGGPGKTSIRAAYGIYYLGSADSPNFGVIGDAPFGLYWASPAPPLFDTPFQTRSNGASQGVHFPFTFPIPGSPANATLNFSQYYPLASPGFSNTNVLTYTEHYNFSIQRALAKSTVLTLAFVGNEGHHLPVSFPMLKGNAALCLSLIAQNATPKCGPSAEASTFTLPDGSKIYSSILGTTNPGVSNQAAGTVAWSTSGIRSDIANSLYNALQVTVERKARDITFLAAYTYSKSMDNTSNLDPFNFRLNRALSPWDMTHNCVGSYNWAIPFDRALRGVSTRVTQGWNLTGITRLSTGLPVTLSQSGDRALDNIKLDVPNIAGPVVTQNPRLAANGLPNMFFLPSAFTSEALGQVGNANLRFFHGPGFINTDLGLQKTIRIRENWTVLLRGEFFNIFNHANFSVPVGNFHASQFGEVTSAFPGRIGQVSAKFMF